MLFAFFSPPTMDNSTSLCKDSLSDAKFQRPQCFIQNQGNQNLHFISCWPTLTHTYTNTHARTHLERRIHTSRLNSSWKKRVSERQRVSLCRPLSLSPFLCVCVRMCACMCWQSFHNHWRENNNCIGALPQEQRVVWPDGPMIVFGALLTSNLK